MGSPGAFIHSGTSGGRLSACSVAAETVSARLPATTAPPTSAPLLRRNRRRDVMARPLPMSVGSVIVRPPPKIRVGVTGGGGIGETGGGHLGSRPQLAFELLPAAFVLSNDWNCSSTPERRLAGIVILELFLLIYRLVAPKLNGKGHIVADATFFYPPQPISAARVDASYRFTGRRAVGRYIPGTS